MASSNLGQFSNSGTREKSEGSRALRQTREKKNKTTQHPPCSYPSGTAVPRIAYSETRKLREQQGKAESRPSEKKPTHNKTTQKGRRENLDSSCSGSWRYEQVNPEHISQSIFKSSANTRYCHKEQSTLPLLLGGKFSSGGIRQSWWCFPAPAS